MVCLTSPELLGALSYLNRETMKPIHYIIYSARHTSRFKSLLLTLKLRFGIRANAFYSFTFLPFYF